MLTPNSSNTPLTPINISDIQIDPSMNSTNLVVKYIMHITLDSHVHPNMTINISAPKDRLENNLIPPLKNGRLTNVDPKFYAKCLPWGRVFRS